MRVRIPFATMIFRQQLALMGVTVDPSVAPSKQDMAFARLGQLSEYVEDAEGNPQPIRSPAVPVELAAVNPVPAPTPVKKRRVVPKIVRRRARGQ